MNTATGPPDDQPSAGGRWVTSTGVAITVIAVGAVLRFAVAGGSPHGLNVHVVGVVLILAGVLGLLVSLLSLLVVAGPRRPHSLIRRGPGGYYRLPGPNARLQRIKEVAAEDVAQIQRDAQFSPPRAPGGGEDDL